MLVRVFEVNSFQPNLAGAIMLVGQVADALATPFAGRESDKSAALCGSYGKRKGKVNKGVNTTSGAAAKLIVLVTVNLGVSILPITHVKNAKHP